jgi:hypothetical protein
MRDAAATEELPDRYRLAVGLGVGEEGGYYVGSPDHGKFKLGDSKTDKTILNNNRAPKGQPELYCKWVPDEDGNCIKWSGEEKFHRYVEWLEYLIGHFLSPWGYKVDGNVNWQGEDHEDFGTIHARNNFVNTSGAPGA